MHTHEIVSYIGKWLPSIRLGYEERIHKIIDEETKAKIHMPYLLGGKYLREQGMIFTYGITNNFRSPPLSLIKAGIAISLAQTASLCHDDVQDHAHERRGVPTLASDLGGAAAIAIGDELLAEAYSVVTDLRSAYPRRQLSQALKYLARGQRNEQLLQQDIKDGKYAFTPERPLPKETLEHLAEQQSTIAYHKTGSLIEAVFAIGTDYGKDQRRFSVEPYYRQQFLSYRGTIQSIGLRAGYCYQLADDLLDVAGNQHLTGKPTATDLRNCIANRVHIEFLKSGASPEEKIFFSTVLQGKNTEESSILQANELAKTYGLPRVERYLKKRKNKIVEHINSLAITPPNKEFFELMIERFISRTA